MFTVITDFHSKMSSNSLSVSSNTSKSAELIMTTNKNTNMDDYIGSGGFGKVFEIKGTDIVKKEMDLRQYENINEICFLSTYKHVKFITQMQKCEISTKTNTIEMYMKYAGFTLRDLSKMMAHNERIKIVPILMTQFARILIWMKQENILHCDIKPANICINKDLEVTLIDWGFVQKFFGTNSYKIGTQVFYDPHTYVKVDHYSEMFAFGLSLCYFVMQGLNYDAWEEFCVSYDDIDSDNYCVNKNKLNKYRQEALDIIEIETCRKRFIDVLGDDQCFNILLRMIDIDRDKRINMWELYDSSSHQNKLKYNLSECHTHKHECASISTLISNNFINQRIFGNVFDWMLNIKFNLKLKCSLFNSMQMFFRYIKAKDVDIVNYPPVSVVCLYLANIMNNEFRMDINKCTKFCELKTKSEIYELIVDIIQTLNFDIYPESINIEKDKNDEDIWRDVMFELLGNKCVFILPSLNQINFDRLYNQTKLKRKNNKQQIEQQITH